MTIIFEKIMKDRLHSKQTIIETPRIDSFMESVSDVVLRTITMSHDMAYGDKEMDESMVAELVDAIEHKLRKFQGLRITKPYPEWDLLPESKMDSELESEYEERTEPNYPDDQYDDAQVLSSAGWGTDEDYGGDRL